MYAKGLCKMHYHRQYRTGRMGGPGKLPYGSQRLRLDDVRDLRRNARALLKKAVRKGVHAVSLATFVREHAEAAEVSTRTVWRALHGDHFPDLDVPALTEEELRLVE